MTYTSESSTLSREDYIAESVRLSKIIAAKQLRQSLLSGIACLVLAVAYLWASFHFADRLLATLAGLTLGVALVAFGSWAQAGRSFGKLAQRIADHPENASFFQPRTMKFDQDGYEISLTSGVRSNVPWSAVVGWHRLGGGIMMRTSQLQFHWFAQSSVSPECLGFVLEKLEPIPQP
jgi:hypothetical protein